MLTGLFVITVLFVLFGTFVAFLVTTDWFATVGVFLILTELSALAWIAYAIVHFVQKFW